MRFPASLGLAAGAALTIWPAVVAAQPSTGCDDATRRAAMTDFVRLVYTERNPRLAYQRYAAPEMRQDNPAFGQDRDSTVIAMAKMLAIPHSHFDVQDVLVDGNLTAVRYYGVLDPAKPGAEVVEFFRWNGPKIVEHWDVFQVKPSDSP